MNCPACRSAMVVLEYNQVELDFCPSCRGCWLDRGELSLLLHGVPDEAGELSLETARKGSRRCPRCGAKMTCGFMKGLAVEVDACPAGHGIWLDAGELEQIVKAKGDSGIAGPLAAFCSGVFGRKAKEKDGST